ncbi:hypothetical protein, partial [Brevibacterium paucivorans]|uniref:hypothetical protein n=1 Tax=Brevibacterium paucivorans TaxID=170994 RepID=UPI0015E12180
AQLRHSRECRGFPRSRHEAALHERGRRGHYEYARCPLCFDGGEVRRAVVLGLLDERRGYLGTHTSGFFLGPTKHGDALFVFVTVPGTLGVELLGGLLPPLRRLFC